MSSNPKLNDLQLVLLSGAARRDDGNVLPAPASFANQVGRIRKAIPPLLRRKLVEEVPVKGCSRAWREDDEHPIGLSITDAGRAIIAAQEGGDGSTADQGQAAAEVADPSSPSTRGATKAEVVLGLLQRAEGATLAELMDATAWLPHTTRAALTRLRKRGHGITKATRDGATAYKIKRAA